MTISVTRNSFPQQEITKCKKCQTPYYEITQPDPKHIAGILARSFYTEIRQAGLGVDLVVYVSAQLISELISELNTNIRESAITKSKDVMSETLNENQHSG